MTATRDEQIRDAARAHGEGRLDEAERMARAILHANRDDAEAMVILGIVAFKRNDPTSALPLLERATQIDPNCFDAPFWLSMIYRKLGRKPEALAMASTAVSLQPGSPFAQNQMGMCCFDLQQADEAVTCYQNAIRIDPTEAAFFDNLGRALQALGRNAEAIDAFRQVLAIGPVRPQALFRLGDAYMQIPDVQGAAQCARAILQMEPQSVQGNLLLSRALIGDGQVEEGAKYAARAVKLAPQSAVPVAYYGRALQSLGRIAEADEQFRRSIELEPHQGFAYHALVHNHKVKTEERPIVEKMLALAADPSLPRREVIQLEYGLGKALEDLGEYEQAMAHFDEANRIDHELKVGVAPFNPAALLETADFLIGTFDREFIEKHSNLGSESELPIFVVGMMRSGTTLAEQILSSHAEIGGVGEQLFWPDNAGSSEKIFVATDRRQTLGTAESLGSGSLDCKRLLKLRDEYLELLIKLSPGKQRVVDKMNTNYLLLGLLHIAFPNARIVHMKRHPVDTCLSIWATPVANGIDLCGDKHNVVFAYRQYLRIMEHWRRVLPADRLLDVQYEDLVSDPEPHTKNMIDFCGMPWDEACMRPEANVRSVKTPSVWQVRQPVYKTSTERWRKYEPWLGAFAELF